MTVKQRLAALADELVERMAAAYRDALETGSPDDLRRAQAAEALLSRVYGKPVQPTEEQLTVPHSVEALQAMTPAERLELLRTLESERAPLHLVEAAPVDAP
jgi:hypothetical protein